MTTAPLLSQMNRAQLRAKLTAALVEMRYTRRWGTRAEFIAASATVTRIQRRLAVTTH